MKERTTGPRVWGGNSGDPFRQTVGPSPVRAGAAVRSDGTWKAWSVDVILRARCSLKHSFQAREPHDLMPILKIPSLLFCGERFWVADKRTFGETLAWEL